MDVVEILLGLSAFSVGLLSLQLWQCVAGRKIRNWLAPSAVLVSLVALCIVGAKLNAGQPLDILFLELLTEAKPKVILVLLAGVVAGAGLGYAGSVSQHRNSDFLVSVVIGGVALQLTATGLLLAWDEVFDLVRFKAEVTDQAFRLEEFARTEQNPIRLAIDPNADSLYFSCYETRFNGNYSGSIFRVPLSGKGLRNPSLAASSPVLHRPFGLACYNGDIFVSRAGHAAAVYQGRIEYASMGAVTQLKDLDHNGEFELYGDVVTGLPAARGPDTMHQNNGIAFDSEGNLFVAVGSSDDRSLDEHPWAGKILRCPKEGRESAVFASGLRNPFGLCCIGNNTLLVTDNDCSEDPGDEVNFVFEGGHYGHPYTLPRQKRVTGFDDAVIVGNKSNYCGIAAMDSEIETVAYVCDRLGDRVLKLTLKISGNKCTLADEQVFARIPAPIDVVVGDAGEMYVASISKKIIYKISPR